MARDLVRLVPLVPNGEAVGPHLPPNMRPFAGWPGCSAQALAGSDERTRRAPAAERTGKNAGRPARPRLAVQPRALEHDRTSVPRDAPRARRRRRSCSERRRPGRGASSDARPSARRPGQRNRDVQLAPDHRPRPLRDEVAVSSLATILDAIVGRLHPAMDAFEADPVTRDLLTALLAMVERYGWMLRASAT
jgi:hypothetical protein